VLNTTWQAQALLVGADGQCEEAYAQPSKEAARLSSEDDNPRRVICSVDPVGHVVGPDVDA